MGEKKDKNLNLRVSGVLLKKVRRAADKVKDIRDAWIRRVLEEAADRELKK